MSSRHGESLGTTLQRPEHDPRHALATGMVGGAIETWDRLEALLAEG